MSIKRDSTNLFESFYLKLNAKPSEGYWFKFGNRSLNQKKYLLPLDSDDYSKAMSSLNGFNKNIFIKLTREFFIGLKAGQIDNTHVWQFLEFHFKNVVEKDWQNYLDWITYVYSNIPSLSGLKIGSKNEDSFWKWIEKKRKVQSANRRTYETNIGKRIVSEPEQNIYGNMFLKDIILEEEVYKTSMRMLVGDNLITYDEKKDKAVWRNLGKKSNFSSIMGALSYLLFYKAKLNKEKYDPPAIELARAFNNTFSLGLDDKGLDSFRKSFSLTTSETSFEKYKIRFKKLMEFFLKDSTSTSQ